MSCISKIIRLNKIVLIICILVLLILVVLSAPILFNATNILDIYRKNDFNFVGYTSDVCEYNSFYSDIDYISIYDKKDNYIKTDVLMTAENVGYEGLYYFYDYYSSDQFMLSENECAISLNASQKYNLNIGDVITVNINFKYFNFTVEHIFDRFYGKNEVSYFNNEYAVVLYYNEDIINNSYDYKVLTYSRDNIFFDGKIVLKQNIVRQTILIIVLTIVGFMFVSLFMTAIIEKIFSNNDKQDLIAFKQCGASKASIFKFLLLNVLYKYLSIYVLPMVITFVFMLLFKACIYGVAMLLICFIISIFESIIMLLLSKEGKLNGKRIVRDKKTKY